MTDRTIIASRLLIPSMALVLSGCIPPGAGPPQTHREPQDQYRPPVARRDDQAQTLPAPDPVWKARDVTKETTDVSGEIYTVRSGDTLRAIADKTGAGSEAIARTNGIDPPYTIYPGQQLRIPAGRYHLVHAGETGIAIARTYGVPWSQVVTANNLEEPYILRIGQRLLIPDNRTITPRERADAFTLDIGDIVTGSEPAIADNAKPAQPTASPTRVLPATTPVEPPTRMKGGFSWPVGGTIIKGYGAGKPGERNDGVNISVPVGTPVLATANGAVVYVGNEIPALGGLVILKHGDGYTSVYGHTSKILVQRGQSVKRGQTIALSGDTGAADQPELHFEIRKGRDPIDPTTKLPSR